MINARRNYDLTGWQAAQQLSADTVVCCHGTPPSLALSSLTVWLFFLSVAHFNFLFRFGLSVETTLKLAKELKSD